MARRGHGCRCCGCLFSNIFRCEQLSVNLWNQSGDLPLVTCDNLPQASVIDSVSAWLTSGAYAAGGSLRLNLDAAGLNMAASSSSAGYQFLRASIFNGSVVVESASAGNGRTLTLNSDTRLLGFDPSHSFSLRSCKIPSGRYATAYVSGVGWIGGSAGVTRRLLVRYRQQGEPGFTNQYIDGLSSDDVQGGGSQWPSGASQACRAAVYRDGMYVGAVARDPSLCTLLPNDETSVSQYSSSFPDVAAEIAAINAQISSIGRVAARPLTPAELAELNLLAIETPAQQDLVNQRFAQAQEWAIQQNEAFLNGYLPPRWIAERTPTNPNPTDAAIASFLFNTLAFKREQALRFYHQETNAVEIAELAAMRSRANELQRISSGYTRPPTDKELQDLQSLQLERSRLQSSLGIYSVADYTARYSCLVRMDGYAGALIFPAAGNAFGGRNIADDHGNHAYWSARAAGTNWRSIDPSSLSYRSESMEWLYVQQGETVRLVIPYGGSATLTTEPSGSILGTFEDETKEEGSYLVVSRYDDDCMPTGWGGVGTFDAFQAETPDNSSSPIFAFSGPQRRYEFNSFVVDKTPPAVVVEQVNDFVEGDGVSGRLEYSQSAYGQQTPFALMRSSMQVYADEPLVNDGLVSVRALLLSSRPDEMELRGYGFSELPAGYYRAVATAVSNIKDRAHNLPHAAPTVEFTVHATMSGARPTFAVAGEVIKDSKSRLTTIDLLFDKPVVGITKRNFTIEGYGLHANGSFGQIPAFSDGLERRTPYDITLIEFPQPNLCRLTITDEMQGMSQQWRIIFQPDLGVLAFSGDDAGLWSHVFSSARPADEQVPAAPEQEYWRIWNATRNEHIALRYDATSNEWKNAETSLALSFGIPDDAEPCILVARYAWVIRQSEAGVRYLIDTSTTSGTPIGSVASVSGSVGEPNTEAGPTTTAIESSGSVSLPAEAGSFHTNHDADSYVPNAPPSPDEGTDTPYGYFGLTTTIYPSPAIAVSACAAPRSAQKHFSAIMSNSDYTTITATLNHVPVNGTWSVGYPRFFEQQGVTENVVVASGLHPAFGVHVPFAQAISFSSVRNGLFLPQNEWFAEDYVSGAVAFNDNFLVTDTSGQDTDTVFGPRVSSLYASRGLETYPGLGTSVAGGLVFVLRIFVFLSRSNGPRLGLRGQDLVWQNSGLGEASAMAPAGAYVATLLLSKSQEYQLATSGSVSVAVPNTSSYIEPGFTPAGLFAPGSRWSQLDRHYYNRHVWTLSAS